MKQLYLNNIVHQDTVEDIHQIYHSMMHMMYKLQYEFLIKKAA